MIIHAPTASCFTYTVGALGWATVRPSTDSNLLLFYAGTPVLAGPFLLCLTASITVGHATGRERVQVAFQQSKGRSESKDGIGPTPMPATQPHPLVRTGHTTSTSKGKAYEQ